MNATKCVSHQNFDNFFSTVILKPSLHEFEFRFHRNLAKGYGSVSKGLGSLLKVRRGYNQGCRFVFVFVGVTSTSRHASGLPRQNQKKGRKLVIKQGSLRCAKVLWWSVNERNKFHHTISSFYAKLCSYDITERSNAIISLMKQLINLDFSPSD